MSRLTPILLFVLLSACAAPRPEFQLKSRFDKQQAVKVINALGSGRITGKAYLSKQDGTRATCATSEVILIPATAYAAERMQALYNSKSAGFNATRKFNFVPDVADFHDLILRSKCDASGEFFFDKLGAGSYYVVTIVRWAESTFGKRHGGSLMKRVTLRKGQKKSVVMTSR